MTVEGREPIPAGRVSRVRGRWQRPALRAATGLALLLAVVALLVPGGVGERVAGAAVAVVLAGPLVRVAWLVLRWRHEHDRRFVAAGLGVLAIIATGTALAVVSG